MFLSNHRGRCHKNSSNLSLFDLICFSDRQIALVEWTQLIKSISSEDPWSHWLTQYYHISPECRRLHPTSPIKIPSHTTTSAVHQHAYQNCVCHHVVVRSEKCVPKNLLQRPSDNFGQIHRMDPKSTDREDSWCHMPRPLHKARQTIWTCFMNLFMLLCIQMIQLFDWPSKIFRFI